MPTIAFHLFKLFDIFNGPKDLNNRIIFYQRKDPRIKIYVFFEFSFSSTIDESV